MAAVEAMGIPQGVLISGILVLLYSFICFLCGLLLLCVLISARERLSYVLLFALSTTLSTTFAIVQQIYTLVRWHESRIQQWQGDVAAYDNPALAFGPRSRGFPSVMYWILVYLYNVDALVMLFWAIALTIAVWDWRFRPLVPYMSTIRLISMLVAVVVPAILSGVSSVAQLHASFSGGLIVSNMILLLSFTLGAVCVFLILAKYMSSRLGIARSYANDSRTGATEPTWATVQTGTTDVSNSRGLRTRHINLHARVDPLLVMRFTIAFVILLGFEIFLILYSIKRYHSIRASIVMDAPDFSVRSSVGDVLNFIPGVTASLLAFFLFGTTAQQRATYTSMFGLQCCMRREHMPSPDRLKGSSVQDWGRITDTTGPKLTDVDAKRGGQPIELNKVQSTSSKKENTDIHITSEYIVTEDCGGK